MHVDWVLAACVLLLLAFPVAAIIAGGRQPVAPPARVVLPAPVARSGAPPLRDLPVLGSAEGADPARPLARAALRDAVSRESTRLLGGRGASTLRRYLSGPQLPTPAGVGADDYPYRYRGLTRFLDGALPARPSAAQAQAAGALGGLLVLAAAEQALPNAGQGAFAVLDRVRAAGACDARLNLAFLVATTMLLPAADIDRELGAADDACPHDPTPLWLHGQWRSLSAGGDPAQSARARALFARLQRRFPGSPAGWSGEADALLRSAYVDDDAHRPFTARAGFERALALYRRARSLDDDPALAAGQARALAGLGRFREAAGVQSGAARAAGRPAALQARLLEYLERAHRFADAVPQARRLAAGARFPRGRALFVPGASEPLVLAAENALEPVSLGAGRLRQVTLDIAPAGAHSVVSPAGLIEDNTLIPTFRPVTGVTGINRWCPEWALRRDLVLAGRPAAALAGMPRAFTGINPATGAADDCDESSGIPELAAIARARAGDRRGAAVRLARRRHVSVARARTILDDDLQNLSRFAGRLRTAQAQVASWQRSAPGDPRPRDRAGEIAFLRGADDAAARSFAASAMLTREQQAGWPVAEARDLVKQGMALKSAGRLADALVALRAGDGVASRALARDATGAAQVLYHARAQAGDILLRRHRFADAVDAYDAARRHATDPDGGAPGERIEALYNNEAIAEIYGGDPGRGLRLVRRAVAIDPRSPLFLETQGFALAHLGRSREAAASYRRAVQSDPTLFPAWNDLGVMLARSGRENEARDALRHAVGVRRAYPTAWFNLGVLLERAGPLHAAAAQGALARAFALDGQLATRRHELLTDERLYLTNLDLSKPLPPTWDFASSQKQWPLPAAGLALVLLLGLQGGRLAAARGLASGAPKWLEAARQLFARLPAALGAFAPSALAVAVTLAVFLWPAVRGDDAGVTSLLVLAIGLALLVTIVLRVRVLTARRAGVSLHQRGWRPAILVGVAAALTGVPWAPLPVAETGAPAPRVHLGGPVAAAATGLALVLLGVWLQVPVTRALGIAAIVMAASMLTPVKPLDGAALDGATGTLTTGFALATMAVLLALGLM